MTRMMRWGLCTWLLCAAALQAAEPIWTFQSDKDINWTRLSAVGNLIVATDEALLALDPTTGQVAWRIDELNKLKEEFFEPLPFTSYAVINASKGALGTQTFIQVIDLSTGEELWNSDTAGIATSMGQFVLENGNMLIYGLDMKDGKRVVMGLDVSTGAARWSNRDFFKKEPQQYILGGGRIIKKSSLIGNQEPVFDTDTTMILFMSKEGIAKYNATNGQLLWTSNAKYKKDPPGLKNGYPQMLLSDSGQLLFVPQEKGIVAIRTKDGAGAWNKEAKLEGMPVSMNLVPEGLLVVSGPDAKGKGKASITILDPATGQARWKPYNKLKMNTHYVLRNGKAVFYNDGNLIALNLTDGKVEELAKRVRFDGRETPTRLELHAEGYLLSSAQNLMRFGFDGSQQYHAYFKAPGSSMFAKIASTAAIAATNVMSAAAAHQRANYTGRDQRYTLITSNPVLSRRFTATSNAENYVYILTEVEENGKKNPGLVKVEKASGQVVESVQLGTKEPDYELDEIGARVFFQPNGKEIRCFDL